MKRFYSKCRIGLITFALGLAGVYFISNIKTLKNTEVTEVIESTTIVTVAPKQPRFTESFRACGMGYVQGYFTNDGIGLEEGTLVCEEPRKRDKRIVQKNNEMIISKIITENRTYYELYQIESGHCISSPSIELGLELKEYLSRNP